MPPVTGTDGWSRPVPGRNVNRECRQLTGNRTFRSGNVVQCGAMWRGIDRCWSGLVSVKAKVKGRMKRGSRSKLGAKTFDGFLAALSQEKRSALEKLRKTIRATVPGAEECISYGIPAFRLGGKFLVGLGAGADHCSFYPGSAL